MSQTGILKRIGAIGDVHADDESLAAVLGFLQVRAIDRILAVGDIVDGKGNAGRCCDLLQEAQVAVVRGNHDRWFLQGTQRQLPDATPETGFSPAHLHFLETLPRILSFETAAGRLLLCHGMATNDMVGVTPDDFGYSLECHLELQALIKGGEFRFIVNGHTHRRMVRTFGRLTVINAGSLMTAQQPGFLVIDFEAGSVQCYNLGAGGAIAPAETLSLLAP